MTVRLFLIGSVVVSLFSWAIWLLIVNYLDPIKAGTAGYLLFFLTLFLAMAGSSSLLGYFIRRWLTPRQLATYAVRAALRQGVLIGLFLVLLLFLQHWQIYRWWLAVLAIILFLVVELTFLGYDKAARRSAQSNTPASA